MSSNFLEAASKSWFDGERSLGTQLKKFTGILLRESFSRGFRANIIHATFDTLPFVARDAQIPSPISFAHPQETCSSFPQKTLLPLTRWRLCYLSLVYSSKRDDRLWFIQVFGRHRVPRSKMSHVQGLFEGGRQLWWRQQEQEPKGAIGKAWTLLMYAGGIFPPPVGSDSLRGISNGLKLVTNFQMFKSGDGGKYF